ncbi:MAG TPA: T9SS type A sorting domain-containing protein [Bacteroidales bacterium]|nr:T9SS type A sorting domain-containing protein [Bacteroidales bacterium]HRW96354.1 T9SS type A sorting domain-containing protein [Bacteroidales bacterium]
MKHITFVIVFMLSLNLGYCQITLEQTYDHSGTFTNLANSGDKFFIMHVGTSQCRIYNTDHSLWKTINLEVPTDNYLYDVKFVSENLFTTDDKLCLAYIYYEYNTVGQYYSYNAFVVDEDGNKLLFVPGCQYMYVHTLSDGSTKMTTYSYDYSLYPYTIQTRVYDLPGHLTSFDVDESKPDINMGNAFPNPAKEFVTIPFALQDSYSTGELIITNAEGKTIRTLSVKQPENQIQLETLQFPRGIYFYYLQSGNWKSAARKLVIQ